jgi:alpha-methylacyl-CoA racemase
MSGALHGLRVIELAGIGPTPLAAMLMADHGADVIRIDRTGPTGLGGDPGRDLLNRGRRSLGVDLKNPRGAEIVLSLVEKSDVLLEGLRPGVAERLGVGPQECLTRNPRLVYGRMTGWGQEGPLAARAGHDITYLALTGALWATGRVPDRPVPPLNLVADFGGGTMFLLFGVLAALHEAKGSRLGQVVDAAMIDGSAVLTTMAWAMRAQGVWSDERGANVLDSGAPFYEVYSCADGGFVAVGAIEPQFYATLVKLTGFDDGGIDQYDVARWPQLKQRWADLFATRKRDEWTALLADTDACVQPVLSWSEAPQHPHLAERGTYTQVDGITQPAAAPRLNRTPAGRPGSVTLPGAHTDAVLTELGMTPDQIGALRTGGVVS